MSSFDLAPLLRQLRAAERFEDAARVLLSAMSARCAQALEGSRYTRAKLLRGVVHLRPGAGYRGLYTLQADGQAAPAEDDAFLTSATAWSLLQRLRVPLAVDVQLATVQPLAGDHGETELRGADPAQFEGKRTLNVMMQRNTTHLLALPLRAAGGGPAGMISIEAQCPRATGRPFVWQDCVDDLLDLADLGAPYLLSLPMLPTEGGYSHPLLPVVGPSMARLVRYLQVFARQDETLLLLGDTGTGKSRLARWCHAISPRAEGPLVTLDLNAIPGEMQQGELFGWRRGAFTGAVRDHDGAVKRAEGGTLFLDEIDKLTLKAQASLLQLLEDGRYRPLGDDKGAREAKVRFIIGTNTDLETAVAEGRFLEDLYYRINVLPVRLPSLSERRDELPAWADFMFQRRVRESDLVPSGSVSADASQALQRADWPGNLRQLDNILRRAFSVALADHLGAAEGSPLVLRAQDVEVALAMETRRRTRKDSSLLSALEETARAFVREAQRREGGLDLEHVNALRGAVLREALEQCDSDADAFVLLGKEGLVRSRNHQRAFKKALEHLQALEDALEGR